MEQQELKIAESICLLIEDLRSLQKGCHSLWKNELDSLGTFNFKSLKVYKVIPDKTFIQFIQFIEKYREKLEDIPMVLSIQKLKAAHSNLGKFDYRVKEHDSYKDKLHRYATGAQEGKMPVNKCLNDLAGFRIQLYVDLPFDEVIAFVREKFPNQSEVKCLNSSKNGYFAVHVYIKDVNQMPVWELQIWNNCDRENNIKSHSAYKQDYTKYSERK